MAKNLRKLIAQTGIFLSCLWTTPSYGQSSTERLVSIEPLNKYAPVKVVNVLDGDRVYPNPLGMHQSVLIPDITKEWIGNLSLSILNQSPKPIIAVEIQLDIPSWQDDPMRPSKVIFVHFGKFPSHALQTKEGKSIPESSPEALNIPPGAEATVSLARALEELKSHLPQGQSIESIDNVWIRVRRVFFQDNQMWVTNAYHKEDATNPGAYLRITPEEFGVRK